MNIKNSIAAVVIATPILFSTVVFADSMTAPLWSGNSLDDAKQPAATPVIPSAQKSTAAQPLSAKKSADTSTNPAAPFWSGNTIAADD